MERGKRDALLGLVFFGAVGLLLWATVSLTDLRLGRNPPLEVFFEDAGGIRPGDPVQVRGKRIGKVSALHYLPIRQSFPIVLEIQLEERIVLRADYSIQIQDTGVLGSKLVQIHDGNGDPLPAGIELHGVTLGNPLDRAAGFFLGKGPAGEEFLGALREIHDFARNLNDPTTSIGSLVKRRELYDEVLGSVQSLRRLFQSIEAGDGLLGRIIKDTALREDFMRFSANIRLVSERLTGTDGAIGLLLNDPAFASRLDGLAEDLARMVADAKSGKGMVGVALRDPIAAGKFRDAIDDLASILKKANDPQAGVLGAAISDASIAADLKAAVLNVRQITEKLNSGQGVLGILISDEDMGVRLRRIFTQVSRAIEDAREAAPIGNFVQVLIGAF
ncbi:MAG: hypothetical protein Fur0037_12470 [Planctomycetota bacterium]